MDPQIEALLTAKDTIINQQQEQIELLKQLAESRRLAHMLQCKELAEHRVLNKFIRQGPWQFACWLMFNDVFPFSLWYHRFD